MARPLLLSCQAVSKAFGTRSLFDDLSFGLFEGDQVGPRRPQRLRQVHPPQDPRRHRDARPRHPLAPRRRPRRLRAPGSGVRRRRHGGRRRAGARWPTWTRTTGPAAWPRPSAAPGSPTGARSVDTLSGGWRKRLAIARELAAAPDILLMDEPTNHLDVDGILWLEGVLAERARACLVVSHDRYFLEHVATRMLELNRAYPDGLFEARGPLQRVPRAPRRRSCAGRRPIRSRWPTRVRREIEWLRRGAKARTTKAKGRIEEAERLIDELAESRARGVSTTARHRLHLLRSGGRAGSWSRAASASRSAAAGSSAISTSSSRRARASACSAPTAAARRRCSTLLAGTPVARRRHDRARRRPAHRALRAGSRRPRSGAEPAPGARARGRHRHLAAAGASTCTRGPSASCSAPSSSRCRSAGCRAASRPAS